MGFGGIPMINTENACASSSTAFHVAWMYVASGMYDVALAVGMEKLYHEDKTRSFKAIGAAVDIEWVQQMQAAAAKAAKENGERRQPGDGRGRRREALDVHGLLRRVRARSTCRSTARRKEQFARVAVKNHYHGSLNPHAQYREVYTLEDILASPPVAEPLTRLMCSPIGDGAAALVLCSREKARQMTTKPVWVTASVLGIRRRPPAGRAGRHDAHGAEGVRAWRASGPRTSTSIEVHDASAPAELIDVRRAGPVQARRGRQAHRLEGARRSTGRSR